MNSDHYNDTNMLNNEQETFLQRYVNQKGDVYGVLKSMGLEPNHLMMWREHQEFELRYKNTQSRIIGFLNSENRVTALRRLNEILDSGVQDEVITQKQRVIPNPKFKAGDTDSGESEVINEYEVTRKLVKRKISAQYLQLALTEDTITQAINVLVNQGIIPENIARKILAKSEEISAQMQACFDTELSKEDMMNPRKAVTLMTQAILKGVTDN